MYWKVNAHNLPYVRTMLKQEKQKQDRAEREREKTPNILILSDNFSNKAQELTSRIQP